jgi:cyclic di-GMP phosphodiesterase
MVTAPAERRCLIVDDEPYLRRVLLHVMESDGFRCVEASNGAEGLERLAQEPVEIILTDLRMPVMSGMELLREVRTRYPDTAVVMITAVADVEVAVSCLAFGASDYVLKPYQLDDVRARVYQALEKRRLVIENREYKEHLEERVADQARRLEELFLAGIQSLATALEAKDKYTRGHSIRVSSYSAIIATQLGISGEQLRQIELGGHVHDIGKIGVRESVLNKPGRLTSDEYQHIMTHPLTGWRILQPLFGDAPYALSMVRSHHERFDGQGIPDGLKGTDIPLEARVAAAADALDAMTSRRPYRSTQLTLESAVEEIKRKGGSQFDPEVVQCVVSAAAHGELRLIPQDDDQRSLTGAPA